MYLIPLYALRRVRNRRRKKSRGARIGFVLYESAPGTQDPIVVIATLKCKNRKTGKMVQVWILRADISPIQAVKQGLDGAICFDCRHRNPEGGFKGRSCYVNLRSPQAIWKAYKRGRYPFLSVDGYGFFAGKKIRFGAYGEPVLIPLSVMSELARVSKGWTGYTHQWRRSEFQVYREYLMASCDSPADRLAASLLQWRTFRVRGKYDPIAPGEISCPASDESGHRTQCERCLLCNGVRYTVDPRKDITLIVHGAGASNFVSLEAIGTAA